MRIYFPGRRRVYAEYGEHTIRTDHPVSDGGDGSAPTPLDLFLASLGTCAGSCALGFMRQRGFDPDSAMLIARTDVDESTGLVSGIDFELQLPHGFPDKYRPAIVNAMKLCTVKKHLSQPPSFRITTV
jgi:ribosomal protein S12 methylthiotransferase accessory factor